MDKDKTEKDPQTIFVCDWHQSLKTIPTILKRHFHLIESDENLSKIFSGKPLVAYRKPKSLKNHLIQNDITPPPPKSSSPTTPCGNCKLCKNISSAKSLTNTQKNVTVKIKCGGNCKSRNVVYAARCTKHDLIYVGYTSEQLSDRFSKHRYDVKKDPIIRNWQVIFMQTTRRRTWRSLFCSRISHRIHKLSSSTRINGYVRYKRCNRQA